MRIAILNWRDSAHPDAGGAEVFVHEIGRRWVADGNHVTLHSSVRRGAASHDDIDGVEVVRTGHLRTLSHHIRAPKAALHRPAPDAILESINTVPYLLPWRSRGVPFRPLVHQLARDVWRSHLPAPAAAAARLGERALYLPYRGTPSLAVSNSTKVDLHSIGVTDVEVIPQGGLGVQPLSEKESVPTFIFVGRLTANKRPDHAMEAFRALRRSLPDARLWVIGRGEMTHSLKSSLPEGAELLGRIGRSELLERMSKAHLLLVTSVREGWGLVVTEASALGTPSVAYDVPGLRDSVKDGVTGLLTQPDPQSLARAAEALIRDPARYSKLRSQAVEWGQSCTWEKTAASILSSLVSIADGRVAMGAG
jgi:glycosyltransferase involved in cell wall biosynthesis